MVSCNQTTKQQHESVVLKGGTVMKIRTIAGAVADIRAADPGSAVTASYLRSLVRDGKIAHVKDGNRVLVDADSITQYFDNKINEID